MRKTKEKPKTTATTKNSSYSLNTWNIFYFQDPFMREKNLESASA